MDVNSLVCFEGKMVPVGFRFQKHPLKEGTAVFVALPVHLLFSGSFRDILFSSIESNCVDALGSLSVISDVILHGV